MGRLLRESFVPILGVLGLLFALLFYVRYQVELEADEVTVIAIQSRIAAQNSDGPEDQELPVFGEADPELDQVTALIAEQKLQQAEQKLRSLIKQRDDSRSLATLGILQYKQKRYSDALNTLSKAAKKEPIWPGLYFYRALVNTQIDAYDEAAQDYRLLIAINPNHFEAHYNLGLLLLNKGDYKQAAAMLQQATEQAGGARKARAHYQYGRALLGDDQKVQAEQQFKLAIRHLPGFVEPRLALAEMEPDTPEGRRAAEEQLLTVLDLAQGNPPALFALAHHYSASGDNTTAIRRYRELLQFDPEYSAGRYNLGLLLLDEKRWEEARAQFNWLIEREPQNAKALFNRGRADYRLKHYDEALADYRQAIKLQYGNYPEAYLNMGLILTAQKDYAAAEQSYRQAIAQRDDYSTAWYNLGLLNMRKKDIEAALDAFKRAVELREDYATAWYNMGVLYAREDRNEESINAYQQAIRLRPKYINAHLNLAVRLGRVGKPDKAIEQYREVLTYDPTYSNAWYNLALVYLELQRHEEAVDALQNVIELEPDNVKALQQMGLTLIALGRSRDALTPLQQAVDIEPDSTELRLALAKGLRADGDLQRAQSELYKGLSLDPNNKGLRAELALLEHQ